MAKARNKVESVSELQAQINERQRRWHAGGVDAHTYLVGQALRGMASQPELSPAEAGRRAAQAATAAIRAMEEREEG